MTIVPFDLAPGARVLVVGAGGGFDFLRSQFKGQRTLATFERSVGGTS